ncbi:MAG: sigma-70 family RNA polymerase sigma factor [Mycoplasma sp.]|nr:sigma-70 family RNA polymerase sigma factor [Mycoplasma sp.]
MNNEDELWTKYSKDKDVETRNKLVMIHRPTSISIAKKIAYKVDLKSLPMDRDDLISVAAIGLIDAVERFDSTKGNKFITFAYRRIIGAIYDEIRELDILSRYTRTKIKTIKELQEQGKTMEEISSTLATSEKVLKEVLFVARSFSLISLNAPLDVPFEGGAASIELIDAISCDIKDPEESAIYNDNKRVIGRAISRLPDKLRKPIVEHYYKGKTLKRLGEERGVTIGRMSHLKKDAQERLKIELKKHLSQWSVFLSLV